MNNVAKYLSVMLITVSLFTASHANAPQSKIGILVFDGFLTSDVTAPIEVFGAATKKSWFSSYEVVVISATKNKTVISEEGLTVVADKTIYDNLVLDVLLVPSTYDMNDFIKDKNLIGFLKKQGESTSWMASNCSGAFLLGEAGILDGKKATTWADGEKGPEWSSCCVTHNLAGLTKNPSLDPSLA